MPRHRCKGWLHITIQNTIPALVRIRLNHDIPHPHYTDISIPEHVQNLIYECRRQTPGQIWDRILAENEGRTVEYTERQVYALWQHINEEVWWLDDDQVKSARMVLEAAQGKEVELIDVTMEKGIDVIAFALKDSVDEFGGEMAELAMDSTWKTNAAQYELYALVGEANGQALVMGFVCTVMTDGSAAKGAKERMLTETLRWFKKHCPNVRFTLTDKDWSEINALCSPYTLRTVFPNAKHQICYWHAIKYIEERLAENKPLAAYDPRKAHTVFKFIDPTWAPGVTRGDIKEYLDGRDVELDGNEQGGIRKRLTAQREVSNV
ncbi:hypothetical protein OE88DRAFT_1638147 [Heliocybe sulcata]|uniref:MULE transposase domain-containing protein n=1 Tax=Heliocybe sulcata TaxID=5364 RepID=A0A5C3MNZ5_9AGAM|nr:hypothetical protein OE88DRAFT_1638147 [Heliocybe sulcata]